MHGRFGGMLVLLGPFDGLKGLDQRAVVLLSMALMGVISLLYAYVFNEYVPVLPPK